MTLNQTDYTRKVLERFDMSNCKPQDAPMITRQARNRSLANANKSRKIEVPYREAIGSLLYLANVTRPDISFAVNLLSRNQSHPTEQDWIDVNRIFRYLQGTIDLSLTYRGIKNNLEIYTDSSFKDNPDSTSTSELAIFLFGDTIMWRSHKQRIPNSSTCSAEYFAMSEGCQEGVSLDKAIRDMLGKTMYPITLLCDNRAARECNQKEGSHKLKAFDDEIDEIRAKLEEREKIGVKSKL
ncbi:secreted RxLR effector protein 161-like [Belonocnema kinseyi]|uniref:secreted RxLR effector protein 161-like n=1 Tax=Belonocnema kinseyi TaxID=2817044 RepID=UPI00143D1146|nr:secreted RxLR effector protein 161-like [Belonocnema kinseyi]